MRLLTRTEAFVLLAVWRLQDHAYSIPLCDELTALSGKKWSLGAVYMPLERLEKKGLVSSYLSGSTPERGGRQKRIYQLTRSGKKALLEVREVEQRFWSGIPQLTLD
ncbi:MAG: hypothetical protein RhofKO_08650 [Rhodothermales bacterium]